MAKWMMGVKLVDPASATATERWLVETVRRLSQEAGLPAVPEVGIYASGDVNAFATGPTKSRALVAVSSELLKRMDSAEVEGVLAHEVAHIANGDMVTMTLLQGVINAFVMFFARLASWSLSQFVDEEKRGMVNFITTFVFEIAFSMLGMIVVAAYSRHREFRADAGAARIVGKAKMIAALKSLQGVIAPEVDQHQSVAAFKISETKKQGLMALISTHPPLEKRIQRLQGA
jgi:heat shock protein HtpX